VLRIDGVQGACERAPGQVAKDEAAQRTCARGGADYGNAAGREERAEVMGDGGQAPDTKTKG
jgi:hypothetical protein